MKTYMSIVFLLGLNLMAFSQSQTVMEDDYQIGIFNQSSSKKGFIFNLKRNKIGVKVATLPLFSKNHKIYSSLGVSGLLNITEHKTANVFGYAGLQRIVTKIGRERNYLNLGAGLGIRSSVYESFELICQAGYGTLNAFKTNQQTTFMSEVGVYYKF